MRNMALMTMAILQKMWDESSPTKNWWKENWFPEHCAHYYHNFRKTGYCNRSPVPQSRIVWCRVSFVVSHD